MVSISLATNKPVCKIEEIIKMQKTALSHNLAWLDIVRLLSILLVIYGHFASVGGFAPNIPGIISPNVQLPLMNGPEHPILNFDVFLINTFTTQSAILGVALFFMVTGYLMPAMLERYSRLNFLINRLFRIFPLLIASTLIVGAYLWLTQKIEYSITSYVTSWSLTYLLFKKPPIMGVLWTLVIEVVFYFISAAIGKFTVFKLMFTQVIILAFIMLSASSSEYYIGLLGKNSLFILYIAIGVAFFLAERETRLVYKIALILYSVVISYFGFQLYKNNIGSTGTYENLGTHLVVIGIFLLLIALDKLKFFARIPKAVIWLADLVYPMYLFHAAIGLATMAFVRTFFNNHIFMLCSALLVTIALAWFAHVTIEKPFIGLGRRLARPTPLFKE